MEQGSTSNLRSFSAVEEDETQQGKVSCSGRVPQHWHRAGTADHLSDSLPG